MLHRLLGANNAASRSRSASSIPALGNIVAAQKIFRLNSGKAQHSRKLVECQSLPLTSSNNSRHSSDPAGPHVRFALGPDSLPFTVFIFATIRL